MSAPGVRHICRAPLPRQSDGFSSPLAQRFDEIDTLLVFDNVLVPWENVLFSRQPELADLIRSTLSIWGGHGFLLRASAKADVLVGAACLVLEQTRLSQVPAVREKLAMLMMYAQAIRAFVLAAEAACQKTQSGLYMPDQAIQNAGRMFATSNYYEAVQILRDLAGGATILAPDMATFKSPETGPYVEKYFSIDDVTAEERLRALHLVSELTTSAFAGRSQLYQMFAESPLMAQAAGLYSTYDRKGAMARAASLAGIEI
jgi:4-hydroxyphenylacetate 3-monooxygenase